MKVRTIQGNDGPGTVVSFDRKGDAPRDGVVVQLDSTIPKDGVGDWPELHRTDCLRCELAIMKAQAPCAGSRP